MSYMSSSLIVMNYFHDDQDWLLSYLLCVTLAEFIFEKSKRSMSSQKTVTSCIKTKNFILFTFVKGVQTMSLTDDLPFPTTKPSSIKTTRVKAVSFGTHECCSKIQYCTETTTNLTQILFLH